MGGRGAVVCAAVSKGLCGRLHGGARPGLFPCITPRITVCEEFGASSGSVRRPLFDPSTRPPGNRMRLSHGGLRNGVVGVTPRKHVAMTRTEGAAQERSARNACGIRAGVRKCRRSKGSIGTPTAGCARPRRGLGSGRIRAHHARQCLNKRHNGPVVKVILRAFEPRRGSVHTLGCRPHQPRRLAGDVAALERFLRLHSAEGVARRRRHRPRHGAGARRVVDYASMGRKGEACTRSNGAT